MSDNGWITGDALRIALTLRAYRVGDEVRIDTRAWATNMDWVGDYPNLSETEGVVARIPSPEPPSPFVVRFPKSGVWNTAGNHTVAWRPKR